MKISRICLSIATVVIGTAPPLWAQAPAAKSAQVVKLALHASATTQPALGHRLLPALSDQVPGNAALIYLVANSSAFSAAAAHEQIVKGDELSDLPLDKLPVADAQKILDAFSNRLRTTEFAARHQDVQWDVGLREHGYNAMFPYLSEMRTTANLLALQTRVQLARGDWPAAERSLQTAFSMARQLDSQPVLVQGLVEVAIVEAILNRGVQAWMSQPNSPNLYWALSTLPHPFNDLHAAAQWEQSSLEFTSPLLALAVHEELPPDRYESVLEQIIPMMRVGEGPDAQQPLKDVPAEVRRLIGANQSKARQYLTAGGMPKQQVDAMIPAHAVGVYFFRQYRAMSDEMWKSWELPYAQGSASIARAEEELKKLQSGDDTNPLLQALPSLRRARAQFARVDWHISVVRVIEAIRDYAAHHDGKAPEKLDQITDLPIPNDPFTGKPFAYHVDGQTAVLEAPLPAPLTGGFRFEMTIAN